MLRSLSSARVLWVFGYFEHAFSRFDSTKLSSSNTNETLSKRLYSLLGRYFTKTLQYSLRVPIRAPPSPIRAPKPLYGRFLPVVAAFKGGFGALIGEGGGCPYWDPETVPWFSSFRPETILCLSSYIADQCEASASQKLLGSATKYLTGPFPAVSKLSYDNIVRLTQPVSLNAEPVLVKSDGSMNSAISVNSLVVFSLLFNFVQKLR